ncbi:MAG: hypothetical protein WCV86_01890 [Patescibacteria group bacterium]|jgi:hypothetical protein
MFKKKINLENFQTHVQTNVSFTSFMTAVTVFFTGLLLTSFQNFDQTVRVPIAFLIVSIFGFLFSTLIYTNAAIDISNNSEKGFQRSMVTGDIFSEYFGVYFLIVAIPLVINVITGDVFLRTMTIIITLAGLMFYQYGHVSIIERHFRKKYQVLSLIILLLSATLYMAQIFGFLFSETSIVFILLLTAIAVKISRDRHGVWFEK